MSGDTERASYRDALLVSTASEAGCAVILTEDLSDGAKLGGGIAGPVRRLLGLD